MIRYRSSTTGSARQVYYPQPNRRAVRAAATAVSASQITGEEAAAALPPVQSFVVRPKKCYDRDIVPDPCNRNVTARNWEAVIRALDQLCDLISKLETPANMFGAEAFEIIKTYPNSEHALAERLRYDGTTWVKAGKVYVWDWSKTGKFKDNFAIGSQGMGVSSKTFPSFNGEDGQLEVFEIIILEGKARFLHFTLTSTFTGSPKTATATVAGSGANYWGAYPNYVEPAPLSGGARTVTLTDYLNAWSSAGPGDQGYAVWDEQRAVYIPISAAASVSATNAAIVRIAGSGCTPASATSGCRWDGFVVTPNIGTDPCAWTDGEQIWVAQATNCDPATTLKAGERYVAVFQGTHTDGRKLYYISDPVQASSTDMQVVSINGVAAACADEFQNAQCVYPGKINTLNTTAALCGSSFYTETTDIWILDLTRCNNPGKLPNKERYLGLRLISNYTAGGLLASRPLYLIHGQPLNTQTQVIDIIKIVGIKESQSDPDFVNCDLSKPNAQCLFGGEKLTTNLGADACTPWVNSGLNVWVLLSDSCLPKPELKHGDRFLGLRILDTYTLAGDTRPVYVIRNNDPGHRLVQVSNQSVNTCKEMIDDEATDRCFWLGKIVHKKADATTMCGDATERYDCLVTPLDECEPPLKMPRGEVFFGFFLGTVTYQSVSYPMFGIRYHSRVRWAKMIGKWWHGTGSDFVQANPCSDHTGVGVIASQTIFILLPGKRSFFSGGILKGLYRMPNLPENDVIAFEKSESGWFTCDSDYMDEAKYKIQWTSSPDIPDGWALANGSSNSAPVGDAANFLDAGNKRFARATSSPGELKTTGGSDPPTFSDPCHGHPMSYTIPIAIKCTSDPSGSITNVAGSPPHSHSVDPHTHYICCANEFDPACTQIRHMDACTGGPMQSIQPPPVCDTSTCTTSWNPTVGLPPWIKLYPIQRIDNSQNPSFDPANPTGLPAGAP